MSRLLDLGKRVSLCALARSVGRWRHVSLADLRSRSRARRLKEAREILVLLAVDNDIASLSDIARLLERSPATVHEALATARKAQRSQRPLFQVTIEDVLAS